MGRLEEELKKTEAAAKESAEQKKVNKEPEKTSPEKVETKQPESNAVSEESAKEIEENTKVQIDWKEIPEDQLLTYLGEKLDREVKSFEELNQVKEVIKEVEKKVREYSSPESEAYDKYFEETSRPMSDFVNLKKDWSKSEDHEVVMDYLKQTNPYLTENDIRLKLDLTYKAPEKLDPEDHTAEEIARRDKEIKLREIEWKEMVANARKYHDESKAKYLNPLEQKIQDNKARVEAGRAAWKEGMEKAIPNNLEFGDFKYNVKNTEDYRKDLSSIDDLLAKYKDDNGNFNHQKLAGIIVAGEQINDILSAHAKHVNASTIEGQMRTKSNESGTLETGNDPKPQSQEKEAEAKFREQIKQQTFRLRI